jgi:hypothetical protein
MICNKCNRNLPDDSEFCQYCGCKLDKTATAPIETVTEEPQKDKTIVSTSSTPNLVELIGALNVDDMTPDDAMNILLKLQAQNTVKAMNANKQTQPNDEEDADFGLVPEKPIYTLALKSVDGETEYLNSLRTVSGERIKYTRRGSMHVDGINGMIDIYDTYLPSGQPYKTIYINMYGAHKSTAAPQGFVFASSTHQTKPKNVQRFKKHVNKKRIICIAAISVVCLLAVVLAVFFLCHTHDYELNNTIAATCSTAGKNTYKCRLCGHKYTKPIAPKHAYVLSASEDATCSKKGHKTYKCSVCNNEYTEEIPQKAHSYTEATCTRPKTCTMCHKTVGSALGHYYSHWDVDCPICGERLFKTTTYYGTGNKIIKNISLPYEYFIITCKGSLTGGREGRFYVNLYKQGGTNVLSWNKYLSSSGAKFEKAISFLGGVEGAILEIEADSNVWWTITIEVSGD